MNYTVFLVGNGNVGKTALTIQFVHGIFRESYDPIMNETYRKQVEVDGRKRLVEVLDAPGTERCTATRDLYMKNGQGFILVYSITSKTSFCDVESLRKQIFKLKGSEDVPIVIVANKCDLEPCRSVTKDQGLALANLYGCSFFETSAKEKFNVNEAFFQIIRLIDEKLPEEGKKKKKCTLL